MVKVTIVVRRSHKDRVGVKAAEGTQGRCIRWRAGKGDVYLARLQQAQHLVAAAGDDLDMHARILPVETIQVGQQELAGYGVAGADGQVSHLQLPGLRQLFLTRFQ